MSFTECIFWPPVKVWVQSVYNFSGWFDAWDWIGDLESIADPPSSDVGISPWKLFAWIRQKVSCLCSSNLVDAIPEWGVGSIRYQPLVVTL
jgi:hypothetical protein